MAPPQGGKAGLAPVIASGKLQGFASVAYSKGHVCTDYNKWCARGFVLCPANHFIKKIYRFEGKVLGVVFGFTDRKL